MLLLARALELLHDCRTPHPPEFRLVGHRGKSPPPGRVDQKPGGRPLLHDDRLSTDQQLHSGAESNWLTTPTVVSPCTRCKPIRPFRTRRSENTRSIFVSRFPYCSIQLKYWFASLAPR